jgi:glycosyltransferase involved in cell wall biosynthesis
MSFYKTNDNRFIVVPEGSYKTVYPTPLSEKEESIVREASDAPEGLRLLHLGRLYPYKGLEELISVFREWPGDHTLTLAGKPIDEAYAAMLRKATEMDSRIRFIPGFVSETDLPAYYANADVAVLPFINIENSGSVIMAMGYGKPVLAPAIGVLKDRLCSQRELLYNVEDGIKGGLNKLSTLKAKQLIVWGQANSAALDQYQWRDFQRVFLNDNHPH